MYSNTLEEHKSHLRAIFQELRDNKLFINGKKSEFFLQEIRYLGHIISKDGIHGSIKVKDNRIMDPSKEST